MSCPRCGHAEFIPVKVVEREREGLLSGIVAALVGRKLYARAGKIVECAKCTLLYVRGKSGVYRPERPNTPTAPSGNGSTELTREQKARMGSLADGDLDFS